MAAAKTIQTSTVSNSENTIHGGSIDTDNQCGLIILGNSGAGKSFLANILLGHDAFAHEFTPFSSVTRITEFQEVDLGYGTVAIFNIPGLLEAEQERIDLTEKEIDRAFALRPNSIVIFVFGNQGGIIRNEDIVAFNAINAAYSFKHESLVFVVNGLPKKRPSKYEGRFVAFLQQFIRGVPVNAHNLCFLDHIDENNLQERQCLKEQLLQIIVEFQPSKHEKKQEITLFNQLRAEKDIIEKLQQDFGSYEKRLMKQIEDDQRLFDEAVSNRRSEAESVQRAIQRQQEIYTRQQCLFEEENRRYETQLKDLHGQVQEAQRNYEMLLKDGEADQQQIVAAQEAYQKLKNAYQELFNRSLSSCPTKKEKTIN